MKQTTTITNRLKTGLNLPAHSILSMKHIFVTITAFLLFTSALQAQYQTVRSIDQADLSYFQNNDEENGNDEPIAPPVPTLSAVVGDGQVTLYWDDVAESHYDPFFEELLLFETVTFDPNDPTQTPIIVPNFANPNNFQGYKVYKSTDPEFLSALRITDNQGNPQELAAEVIYDLQNDIRGYHPTSKNGQRYWLGNDNGLQRTWTDTQVTNGRVYYYAVVSFTFGDALPEFPLPFADDDDDFIPPFANEIYTHRPLESPLQIEVQDDGVVITGLNVVKVTPRATAAGYIPPQNPIVDRVSGSAGGVVDVEIIDPNALRGGNQYSITFEDTVIPGGTGRPDLPATKNFSMRNLTTGELIFDRIEDFRGVPLPIREGLQLTLENAGDTVQVNTELSEWVTDQISPIHPFEFGIATRFPQLADYRVEFFDEAVRTSQQYSIEVGGQTINMPPEEVNFIVYNETSGEEIDFAFFANPLVPRDFRKIQFLNTDVGYASGGAGIIQRSDDGGETWLVQETGTNVRLNGMHFTDVDNGWAVGRDGTVITTSNGGDIWEAQTTPTESRLLDVYFLNNNTGWAAGEGGRAIRTTDGGNTWEISPTGVTRRLNSLHFSNANDGWIVGFPVALRTTDGGQSWEEVTIGPLRNFTSVYFTDDSNGWILANTGGITEIYRTQDGGDNWDMFPVEFDGSGVDMSDIKMVDNLNGYIAGNNGTMGRTTDGGETWTRIETGTQNTLFSVSPISSNQFWAAGNNSVILSSDDSGASVDRVPTTRRFRAFIDESGNTRSDEIYFLEDFAGNTNTDTWKVSMLASGPESAIGTTVDPAGGDELILITVKPFTSADEFRFTIEAENQPSLSDEIDKDVLKDIRVVPNPYLTTHIAETTADRQLHFTNLPSQCTIRIFTVSGRLVQTLNVNNSIDNDRYIWDMRTKDDRDLAYGVYIYHVTAPGIGEKTGKFAVIK